MIYRPFVRWWWNGNKIERDELARELRVLKAAGIGGVEINPIKFPSRTDDMGKDSLQWLSAEWIDLLKFAFDEARSLGMACDLIVGSGWPFGAEWLQGDERAQIVTVAYKKLEGPVDYEVSLFELFKEADPLITSPFPGRTMEMLSVHLAPADIIGLDEVTDLSTQIPSGTIRHRVPKGKHVLYAVAKVHGFMQVIQGAPGASGPVLNHYNKEAVQKYLTRMSDTIKSRIGPLSSYIRALFTDSLELEGGNWCADMAAEFQKRRGYDLLPWLPFILFRIGGMGNTFYRPGPPALGDIYDIDPVTDFERVYEFGAEQSPGFKEKVGRVRYDFELTKTELITERFAQPFFEWCKQNKVQSRIQAYGRGFFPLEGSFDADIPEGETWLRPGLGDRMSENDYRIGRAYTTVNKFVSSAAHLKGKKCISSEELTNIHHVFNESLELMKIAGDQGIISGTTHPVFHGFNYSPPDAPFPGWVIYGTYLSERNPLWPWFRQFTDYKARLSALLQQGTMFADIAILPPVADLWTRYGAQNDPFPEVQYPAWLTLIWESIHQNGNSCDYISEGVLRDATIVNGYLQYGDRKYHSVFLPQVVSVEPATATKLMDFVSAGGKVFFIEQSPSKAPGWKDHDTRDREVVQLINSMKDLITGVTVLRKPGKDHTNWFKEIQDKHVIRPYIKMDRPNRFVSQVRYQAGDSEILVISNANRNQSYQLTITPTPEITSGRTAWIWNPENGERYKIENRADGITLDLGPAELKVLVFDKSKDKKATAGNKPNQIKSVTSFGSTWQLEGQHTDGSILRSEMTELKDLKNAEEWKKFSGIIIYRNKLTVANRSGNEVLDLGKVHGIAEVWINGENAGATWYGRRNYKIGKLIKNGENVIEVRVVTTMGNYMKSLTDNRVAQFWTNEGRTTQHLQSVGLIGPVSVY